MGSGHEAELGMQEYRRLVALNFLLCAAHQGRADDSWAGYDAWGSMSLPGHGTGSTCFPVWRRTA